MGNLWKECLTLIYDYSVIITFMTLSCSLSLLCLCPSFFLPPCTTLLCANIPELNLVLPAYNAFLL